MSKTKYIEETFSQFNCAQSVFSLYAPELGVDEKTALKIASGFGSGMTCGETCGAVTGAYMVIGLKHGHCTSNPDKKAATKQKIRQFNDEFLKNHPSLKCKELIGIDISTPEGLKQASEKEVFRKECYRFIKTSCEIIEQQF